MIYLYVCLAIIIAVLIYMRYEASTVKVERIKFTLSKKGLKIIQLSDIHIKYLKVSAQTVRKVIER
jgi:predicted MPP superfamily phosphohydrolase